MERDFLNDEPMCMQSLHWLFNAVREPRIGIDKMHRSPGNDSVIVLRRGHVFQVSLTDKSGMIPFRRLKAAFDYCLACSEDYCLSVATVTADGRDSWAEVSILETKVT